MVRDAERDRRFIDVVKAAVRRSVAEVASAHPNETLAGYALLTDDGVGTLLHRAVTQEALAQNPDSDLLFEQTDWPFDDGRDAFDSAQAALRERAESDSFEEHVPGAFSDLERALAELRAEGLFGPMVFLSVASTDPNEYTLALEHAAVERLNSAEIANARREFLGRWNQHA